MSDLRFIKSVKSTGTCGAADCVVIPAGITNISLMILDINELRDPIISESYENGFPLYKYSRIKRLVIPSSVDIPHQDECSPFASYKLRPYVCDRSTEWSKILIDEIENHSDRLLVVDGVLYSGDMTRLIYCFENKRDFVVPDSVTTIEPYAFCMQEELKEIELHDRIISIGRAAFMGCKTLDKIVIPRHIKKIPADCFDGCSAMREIILPEGLEGIGYCALRHCVNLETIKLPSTLTYLSCFEGCSKLTEIEIPGGVEYIAGFLFCSSLRKVVLNKGVKQIGSYCFRFCGNLQEINFPEGLECIGARAFYPSSLRHLIFPTTLKEIGSEAFYHNDELNSIEFKASDIKIEQAAFACCSHLRNISTPENMRINEDVFAKDPMLDKYGFWD